MNIKIDGTLLQNKMKISHFFIFIFMACLVSGCTSLLKSEKESDIDKPVSSTNKKHKTAGDIYKKKIKQPSETDRKKEMKIEKEKAKKREIEKYLALAEKTLSEKKYDETLKFTKKIQRLDPDDKRSLHLENEDYYLSGKTLYKDKQYLESLNKFEHIKQDYKDVKEITATIKTKINSQAEIHYKKGVKFFINEELKKAIEEWEKTLVLNPDHPKAMKDIENAKHLLEELEKIQ